MELVYPIFDNTVTYNKYGGFSLFGNKKKVPVQAPVQAPIQAPIQNNTAAQYIEKDVAMQNNTAAQYIEKDVAMQNNIAAQYVEKDVAMQNNTATLNDDEAVFKNLKVVFDEFDETYNNYLIVEKNSLDALLKYFNDKSNNNKNIADELYSKSADLYAKLNDIRTIKLNNAYTKYKFDENSKTLVNTRIGLMNEIVFLCSDKDKVIDSINDNHIDNTNIYISNAEESLSFVKDARSQYIEHYVSYFKLNNVDKNKLRESMESVNKLEDANYNILKEIIKKQTSDRYKAAKRGYTASYDDDDDDYGGGATSEFSIYLTNTY